MEVLKIPAWDYLPYDRVSPNPAISSQRAFAFSYLAELEPLWTCLILTTVNAYLQRLPPELFQGMSKTLKLSKKYPLADLLNFLEHGGYLRTDTVREAGEFAVKSDILDIFHLEVKSLCVLDFFGDELGTWNFL